MNKFSSSFDTNGYKDIDLELLSPRFDPFLYNGFDSVSLPASGNGESFMGRLIKHVIGSAIISDPSFRNLPAILSTPTA